MSCGASAPGGNAAALGVRGTNDAARGSRQALRAVFALAIALRLFLAWYNIESNDDHLTVVRLILETGHAPHATDCWSCYHPLAYHEFCAWIATVLDVEDTASRIRLFQMVNVLAGVATLALICAFLQHRPLPAPVRLASLALVALNPALAAINIQVTNDSFLILYSTATLFCMHRFVTRGQRRWLHAAALMAMLGAISKGSGLVLVGFTLLVAAIGLLPLAGDRRLRRQIAVSLVGCVLFFAASVPWLGSYYRNFVDLGSPLAINVPKTPWPSWFTENGFALAGTSSIAESFFTFRLFDLLETPYLVPSLHDFPRFRKSLWTQVYARYVFSRFAMYPETWKTHSALALAIGRAEMVLGLLPLACLLLGAGGCVRSTWRLARSRSLASLYADGDWVFPLFAGLFIAMLIKLNLDYGFYFTMKAIYVLPAILAFTQMFTVGARWLWSRTDGAPSLRHFIAAWVAAILLVNVVDLAILGFDLQRARAARPLDATTPQSVQPILAPKAGAGTP
jgi:hypothetical protein